MRSAHRRKPGAGWVAHGLSVDLAGERIERGYNPKPSAFTTALKTAIIDAHSAGALSQEIAIVLIRAFALEAA